MLSAGGDEEVEERELVIENLWREEKQNIEGQKKK